LYFGKIHVGIIDKESKAFRIKNIGNAQVSVQVSEPANPDFSITSGGGTFTLVGGQSQIVRMLFTPTSGSTNGTPTRFRKHILINASTANGVVLEGRSPITVPLRGRGAGTPRILPSRLLLYPNPEDPDIATVVTPDGSDVTFQGVKNSDGIPQSIGQLSVGSTDEDPTKTVTFTPDDTGRFSTGAFPNGTIVTLTYGSPTQVGLQILDPQGNATSLVYDTTTGTISVDPSASTQNRASLPGQNAPPRRSAFNSTGFNSANAAITGTVTVTCKDGNPISDAIVSGTYYPSDTPVGVSSGFDITNIVATPGGKAGDYIYEVPQSSFASAPDLLSQIRDTLETQLGGICSTQDVFEKNGFPLSQAQIAAITASLLAQKISPKTVVQIGSLLTGLVVACTTKSLVDLVDTITQHVDPYQAGGYLSFTAKRPNVAQQEPLGATLPIPASAQYYKEGDPAPSFKITFPCIKLQISPASSSLKVGDHERLTASATDSNNNSVSLPSVFWLLREGDRSHSLRSSITEQLTLSAVRPATKASLSVIPFPALMLLPSSL
jgi:hypothetical protein